MPKRLNFWFYVAIAVLLLDITFLYLAIKAVHIIRLDSFYPVKVFPFSVITIFTLGLFYIFNVYQFYRGHKPIYIAIRAVIAVFFSALILSSLLYTTKSTDYNSLFWRGNLPLTMLLYSTWAFISRYFFARWHNNTRKVSDWIFISKKDCDPTFINAAKKQLPKNTNILYCDYDDAIEILENCKNNSKNNNNSVHILLLTSNLKSEDLTANLLRLRMRGAQIFTLSSFYEQYAYKIPVSILTNDYFVFSQGFSLVQHDIELKLKRIIDILIATLGLIFLSPIMLMIALGIKISSTGPIVYRQTRCGQRNAPFVMRKFRSMVQDSEPDGAKWAQKNDPRITPFGNFLRKTRLDELPQLWNILKGEMSFIGPRPERPEFVKKLEQKIPYYDLRHVVKPGLTGWAQVMYPYGNTYEDALAKLEYDLFYIKNYSLTLELYILIRTVRTVFSREGV